jgi:hypothetical protein
MNKSLKVAFFLAFLAVGGTAFGAGLSRSIVSAQANWVAHLDVEKFNQTEIGKMVRAQLQETGDAAKLEQFKAISSFHPLDDIKGVTLYGRGKEQANAVAVFEATFNKDTLLTLLRYNPTFTEAAYGDHQIRSWIDDKENGNEAKRQYGCFHGDNLVVLGSSLETVKHSLDVLDGKADNARTQRQFGLMRRRATQGAFIVAAADGVGKMAEQWQQTVMLKNTEQSSLIAGETEGKLFVELNLLAVSEQTAQELMQVAQGIIAMLNLAGKDQPHVAELASGIKVTAQENLVRVRLDTEAAKVASFIKDEWNKKQQQEAKPAQQDTAAASGQ